ncbi:MAG TPA: hypothetical protein HA257_03060 [Candidatus Methanoperedenaceae archaeon]|nr:hypothetical protein [Candidatus Methanoperedenaceae archaeon]
MNKIALGVIFGIAFGIIDVLIMLPIKFEDPRKRLDALSGAFIDRFMIGFLIPNVELGVHPALAGFVVGAGLSLPSAIITRAYAPIIAIGAAGGLIIGIIAGGLA